MGSRCKYDNLNEKMFTSSTDFKPTKKQRRNADSTSSESLLLERDSSYASLPSSMSPYSKSLLDEFEKFMDEINKEKEINVDPLKTHTSTVPHFTNNAIDAEKFCNGFEFSIPDFAPKAGVYIQL